MAGVSIRNFHSLAGASWLDRAGQLGQDPPVFAWMLAPVGIIIV